MITYSWTINTLNSYPEYEGEQNVVSAIGATYTGVDGQYSFSINILQSLIINNTGTFTPYQDLTENQVLGWLLAELTPEQIDQMQAKIQNQIIADQQPHFVQLPLPWSN